jgi:hypothetical protein
MNAPTATNPMRRRTSKCEECPYKDAKPCERSRDELAYARCTPPELFECHMEGGGGHGDGVTMCRGHWEVYQAAVRKGIEADESAGDRVFGECVEGDMEKFCLFPNYQPTPKS